ncbi:Bestrophin-like protein [Meloidogyne graminicola]|uniref:Bestrophin homolog n=1 Tax=Meloidogyne graminicola TaxID=189291 RepID=A0A8S9ZUZ9_9BILA|nr:Bestrophin-like protein [Meloidogyne graminicola]
MAPKTLRPYIKSSIKSNLNINSNDNCKQILEELGNFLEIAGFVKKAIKKGEQQNVKENNNNINNKNNYAIIGIRSIFREIQNKLLPKALEDNPIFGSIILFDSILFNTSALKQIFTIFAFNSISIKFFIIPQLSIKLSSKLNFGKCSSLLIYNIKKSEYIRELIIKNLKPIEKALHQLFNILFYSSHMYYYQQLIFSSSMLRWRGSIWKAVLKDLIAYYIILYVQWGLMDEKQKEYFTGWIKWCEIGTQYIPLSFLLGFFVAVVVARWWEQFNWISWPDKLMMTVSTCLPGKENLEVRKTIARWSSLQSAIAWTGISVRTLKRFPTERHLVESKLMTEEEYDLYMCL